MGDLLDYLQQDIASHKPPLSHLAKDLQGTYNHSSENRYEFSLPLFVQAFRIAFTARICYSYLNFVKDNGNKKYTKLF